MHEWFGIGMTVLLIVHHILNRKWYAALFKGKYNAYRVITVIVNTLLLASIVLTAVCGIAMSAHAVPFLYGVLPVSFARRFHLAMSFWSFIIVFNFHQKLFRLDCCREFFFDLADQRFFRCLPSFDLSSGKLPIIFVRTVSTLRCKDLSVLMNDGCDNSDRFHNSSIPRLFRY